MTQSKLSCPKRSGASTKTKDTQAKEIWRVMCEMNLYGVRSGARSQDYPFTYIEVILDSAGKGSGTLIPAAKIYFDKEHGNQVDIENFGIYPARLGGVQLRSKPP